MQLRTFSQRNNFQDAAEEINLFYSNTLINKPNRIDKKPSVDAPNVINVIFLKNLIDCM